MEIEKAEDEIAYFDRLLQQVETAREEDIEEIREELREQGYLKKKPQSKGNKKNKQATPAPEAFEASDGTLIYVGRNNKQNEYLTNRLAHKTDIWLHAKDIPGSHVVIKSSDPNEDTLFEAAQLAANFSKSSRSSSVPVDYTLIRHVKKPSGAKPGFVTYDNQQTLFVTPDDSFIKKLRKNKKNSSRRKPDDCNNRPAFYVHSVAVLILFLFPFIENILSSFIAFLIRLVESGIKVRFQLFQRICPFLNEVIDLFIRITIDSIVL